LCNGILVQLLADSTVIDVAATSTNISGSTTVIAEIAKIYAAIPNTLDKSKVKIFVSKATATAYKQALVAANPALVGYNQGDYTLRYIDVELVEAPGMPTNKAVAADPENLWMATDLMSDESELNVISMKGILGEPTVRMITEFKLGFGYGVGAEIVYYA